MFAMGDCAKSCSRSRRRNCTAPALFSTAQRGRAAQSLLHLPTVSSICVVAHSVSGVGSHSHVHRLQLAYPNEGFIMMPGTGVGSDANQPMLRSAKSCVLRGHVATCWREVDCENGRLWWLWRSDLTLSEDPWATPSRFGGVFTSGYRILALLSSVQFVSPTLHQFNLVLERQAPRF